MTGPELRQRRQVLGLRRKAFAALLDIHWQTLTKWERSERKISPMAANLIRRICDEHQGQDARRAKLRQLVGDETPERTTNEQEME
jgi:hypothetical protein